MAAMKENTRKVFEYVRDHQNENIVAADVAEALGLTTKQVDGSFTSGIVRKKLGYREEVEITLADGSHRKPKYFRLTDEGMAYDPDLAE